MARRSDLLCSLLFLCLSLITLSWTGCFTTVHLSSFSQVPQSYRAGISVAPQPTWSKVVKASETDILQYLDSRRLLVGTMRIETTWMQRHNQFYDRLLCLDAETGDTIWVVPRDGFGKELQTLVAVRPAVVILGENESGRLVSILDPATGRLLTSRPVSGALTTINHGQSLVISRAGHDTAYVECVAIADGHSRWGRLFPEMAGASLEPKVLEMDSVCVVTGIWSVMLRSTDGTTVWKTSESLAGTKLLTTSDLLISADSAQAKVIRTSSGAHVWTAPATDVQLVASDGVRVLVATKADHGIQLRALDITTGIILWETRLDGLHSPVVFDSTSAYLTTGGDLLALRLKDGSRRFSIRINPEMKSSASLPDVLSIRGSRLYLARERGIAAWDIAEGSQIYDVPLGGSIVGTLDYHDRKLANFFVATAMAPDNYPSVNQRYAAVQSHNLADWAQARQRYVYQNNAAMVRSGTISQTSAANRNEMAAREAAGWAAAEANMQALVSAAQFGHALGMGIVTLLWEGVGTDWVATHKRMIRTVQNGYRSIFSQQLGERYFVRPTFRNGLRLSVVRLADGYRADIQLFPGMMPFKGPDAWQVPAISISPNERSIAVRGLIADSTRYLTYELMTRDDWRSKDVREFWIIPYPFVMSLPIDNMHFLPPGAKQPVETTDDSNARALIAAVLKGDLRRLQSLLDTGVSPDVRDEFGHTALMYASQMFNAEMIRLFIDRGANVLMTDEEGVNAPQYMNYPPRPPSEASSDALMLYGKTFDRWAKAPGK